ncbi:hypothetical protein, conserved [Leishmania tarentolae]|uniref:Uncharacterized protein n=1 Tax=Leishmania tarentolae TaxID=5689 RepID=A0A640KIR2_LEITA|nr:hypothetical protein, conserved [Leishmania tarentolae]
MLSPSAYRAALLDLLTSSAADSQERENEVPGMQASHVPVDLAQTRGSYVPSLRLAHSRSPSFAEEDRAASTARTALAAAAAAETAPSAPSHSLVGPVKGTPSLSESRCVIEGNVRQHGNARARACATSNHGCSAAHEGVARQPPAGVVVVEEGTRRSLILSFIDNCICAGVPETVIAEQVQFMVSSMKESLVLHAALHARQHKDRIREYEVSELTAMLERQQLQFAQQQQQQPAVHSKAEGTVGAQPFHYVSISQRLSDDLGPASATRETPPQHCADNGRPLLSSRHAESQATAVVNDRGGSSAEVPVSSWRPRSSAHASATETATAPVARSKNNAGGGADTLSSGTGHACAQPHTQSIPLRWTSASHRSSHARDSSSHHHPVHSRHHKLCSVCYPSSSSSQLSSTSAPQAVEWAASPVDDRLASQRCSPKAQWQQSCTPSQHYMKPTHTSLTRRESKSPAFSHLRRSPPLADCGLRDEGHVQRPSSQWRTSGNSPLHRVRPTSAVTGRRASLQKLIVRSTYSSRLRAAAASRRQSTSPVSASRASCEDEDELNDFGARSDAAVAPVLKRPERMGRLYNPETPHAQESVERSTAVVADDSLSGTLMMRADPWSGTPPSSPSARTSNSNAPRNCARVCIDNEPSLGTSGRIFGRGEAVRTTMNATAPRDGSEKSPSYSTPTYAASSLAPAAATSAPTVQNSAPSQTRREAAQEQVEHYHDKGGQKRRPHRPPPPPQVRLSPGEAGPLLDLPASVVAVVDDSCSDPNVCVTSPELQLFMELSQRKLRETERVLAQAPTPSHIASASHLCQSPSSMSIVKTVQTGALRDSIAVSSCAPFPVDAQQTPLLTKSWSHRSLDAVRAQQQQRLADLRRRFSSYGTASDNSSPKSPHSLPGEAAGASSCTSVVSKMPHDLQQQSSSIIFQPRYAPSASLENSPLVQISPTSSDEQDTHEGNV